MKHLFINRSIALYNKRLGDDGAVEGLNDGTVEGLDDGTDEGLDDEVIDLLLV